MDKQSNAIKATFIAVFTTLNAWLGILAIPVIVLVISNITDYFTGLAAAKYRDEKINSDKGFRGITKKICMWLLVGVGAAIDWVLLFATDAVGIHIPITFAVACLAAVWLICNELISILENISDIGVELPPFLIKIVVQLKSKVEDKSEEETK